MLPASEIKLLLYKLSFKIFQFKDSSDIFYISFNKTQLKDSWDIRTGWLFNMSLSVS